MRKLALASICLYFFVCPLEFVFNVMFGSSVKFVALFSVAAIILYYISDRKVRLKVGIIQYALLAWMILEAASLLWTTKATITMDRLETYMLMSSYVLLVSVFPFERKELEAIALVYAIGSLIALALLFIIGDLHGGYNTEGRRTITINGKYQDPNGLAAYLIAGTMYFFDKIFSKKWYSVPSAFIFVLFVIGILQTGSRGALVALAVTLLLILILRTPRKSRGTVIIGIGIAAIIVYFALMLILPSGLFNRLFNIQTYLGGAGRVSLWTLALEKVFEHPFFGNGIASHLAYFYEVINDEEAMHNTYLCVLFEVGITGLVAFVTPFLMSLYNSIKKHNMFVLSIVLCNMAIVFFLDSVYLRYIWNALMIGVIFYNVSQTKRGEN